MKQQPHAFSETGIHFSLSCFSNHPGLQTLNSYSDYLVDYHLLPWCVSVAYMQKYRYSTDEEIQMKYRCRRTSEAFPSLWGECGNEYWSVHYFQQLSFLTIQQQRYIIKCLLYFCFDRKLGEGRSKMNALIKLYPFYYENIKNVFQQNIIIRAEQHSIIHTYIHIYMYIANFHYPFFC